MLISNNRVLISPSGKIYKDWQLPNIEFTLSGNIFPDGVSSLTALQITSSVNNEIYIDFGDGSEIYSREFSGLLNLPKSTPIHTYSSTGNYGIKVWFKFPSKITDVLSRSVRMIGNFPTALKYYKLNSLTILDSSFNNIDLAPAVYDTLSLRGVTSSNQTNIPSWIFASKIKNLEIGDKFVLTNTNTQLEQLMNVVDLESVIFDNSHNITDVPINWRNKSTLRSFGICLSENALLSITENINACKQLTTLAIGYGPDKYSIIGGIGNITRTFTWGYGVENMPNLINLYMGNSNNIPTTLPTGITSAPNLKTLYFRACYKTETRMTEFITNCYNEVVANASKISGNTLLRQMRLEICRVNVNNVPRPVGTYQQPSGYVQGSSNGTPASPMEMLWVLVKQYRWTILVTNTAGNGNETLTP